MIKFKDLSMPLKILVIIGWIVGILNVIAFLYGFILGLTGL